jgi:hypothetical protein
VHTITTATIRATVAIRAWQTVLTHRLEADERGEGVISAAIAVLVFAVLGGLMYVGFQAIWGDVEQSVSNEVTNITDGG